MIDIFQVQIKCYRNHRLVGDKDFNFKYYKNALDCFNKEIASDKLKSGFVNETDYPDINYKVLSFEDNVLMKYKINFKQFQDKNL